MIAGLAAMAGAPAGLPAGVRLSDHISLGVIARAMPPERVRQVLAETGKASARERDLPAQVMVYYAIALALYMGSSTRAVLRCLLEGLRWLWGAEAVKVAGKSGISQARRRLGEAPLRRLYEVLAQPIATRASKGAWYRDWRLVSLDGSCLEVADTAANRTEFGVPGASRGASAFPQLRFAALVENGTHVLFGARLGPYGEGETTLAHAVLAALCPGMLCLADRQFFGYALWRLALDTGADLLWRVKHNLRLPREAGLADGSYLTTVYPSDKDRPQRQGPAAPPSRGAGARRGVPVGGGGRGRAALSVGDHDPRSGTGARRRTGRALPRALGNRRCACRTEDATARGAGRAPQHDPRAGPAGVLGPAAGAFRRARAHARSGLESGRGPRPPLLLARRAHRPPQAAVVRRAFPLGQGAPGIGRCWTRSWRSAWLAAAAGRCRAGSSAR